MLKSQAEREDWVMGTMVKIHGAIVDSWLELSGPAGRGPRVVLQLATKERPRDLLIVEAEMSLVERDWLQDLGENLCHGSPVAAIGLVQNSGLIQATHLQFAR